MGKKVTRKQPLSDLAKHAIRKRLVDRKGATDHLQFMQTYIRIRTEIHDGAKICAERSGMSLASFCAQAIGRAVMNWRDPITGARVIDGLLQDMKDSKWEGWVCTHGSHPTVHAFECPHKEKATHQAEMYHEAKDLWGWQDLTDSVPDPSPEEF